MKNTNENSDRLKIVCGKILSPLVLHHGFKGPFVEGEGRYLTAQYVGKKTAIQVEADTAEKTIDTAIVLLVDGKLPKERMVDGKNVFDYVGTAVDRIKKRTSGFRKVSFTESQKRYEETDPRSSTDLPKDWVEEGLAVTAYYFREFAGLILTDSEDIFEPTPRPEGKFKF